MDQKMLDALPLGVSSFSLLRRLNRIYVDKTDLIYRLASGRKKLFLTRPRRFGKSLLVSTFESLFKYGLRDFSGLKIADLWNEDISSYKVIHLDFSGLNGATSKKEFSFMLGKTIARCLEETESGYSGAEPEDFDLWLRKQKDLSVVLLIDEYDSPLTAVLDRPELFFEIRDVLANFYSYLKTNDRVFRFVFITGITKFSNLNIFSQLNDLEDITLNPYFGGLLGYTHSEIKTYFGEYIQNAALELNLSEASLFNQLIKNYDGFCFERTAQSQVFAPWSIMSFFQYPSLGFLNYWFESGGKPAVLLRYFKSHSLRRPEEYGKDKNLSLSELAGSSDMGAISDLALLTQTGYLTIKDVKYGIAHLGYPNAEVRTAMANLYLESLLKGRLAGQVGAGGIVEVLTHETPESLFHILNRLFASIDYQNYPVKDEASLRGFVQVYFSGAGLNPHVEHHSSHGRSDLEVKTGNRQWILEFKLVDDDSSETKRLEEALIQLRKYGQDSSSKEVLKVALIFSKEKRTFVKWKALNSNE